MRFILPTYHCRNGSREAVDGEAARSVLEDGEGGLQCKFGSGDSFYGYNGDRRSSSRPQLDVGCLGSVSQQRSSGSYGGYGLGANDAE
jgi:hypothetical protein